LKAGFQKDDVFLEFVEKAGNSTVINIPIQSALSILIFLRDIVVLFNPADHSARMLGTFDASAAHYAPCHAAYFSISRQIAYIRATNMARIRILRHTCAIPFNQFRQTMPCPLPPTS
jgi:hypothetical protein